MSLVIDAPIVEGKIRNEAAKRGMTPEAYVEAILTTHLQFDRGPSAPFYEAATNEEWNRVFDAWIDSHPVRQPLPDAAITRESIYEGS